MDRRWGGREGERDKAIQSRNICMFHNEQIIMKNNIQQYTYN